MENKRVTHTARTILRLWNVGWFLIFWVKYYNRYMFDTYKLFGALFSALTFFIIYSALCNVYKAFRIASTDVSDIVFSQFVSFAAGDLLLYVECSLVYNQIRNFIPTLVVMGIQLAGTSFFFTGDQALFHAPCRPSENARYLRRTVHGGGSNQF